MIAHERGVQQPLVRFPWFAQFLTNNVSRCTDRHESPERVMSCIRRPGSGTGVARRPRVLAASVRCLGGQDERERGGVDSSAHGDPLG